MGMINGASRPGGRRLVHIDFLRLAAIYFVLFNHTGEWGFFRFARADSLPQQIVLASVSIFCKVSVPLFFMITGATLLGKQESLGTLLKKRVLRMLIMLAAVSLVDWVWISGAPLAQLRWTDFIRGLYAGDIMLPLWYLYCYVGLLLMMPLLRKLVQVMQRSDYLYLAAVALFFNGVVPVAEWLILKEDYVLNRQIQPVIMACSNIVYPLMGYYIEHVMDRKRFNARTVLAGALLSAVAVLVCVLMTLYRGRMMGVLNEEVSQMFHEIIGLVAIPVYTLYIAAKTFFMKVRLPDWAQRLIAAMGGTVFGVYLFEAIIRAKTVPMFYFFGRYMGTMAACMLWIACAILIAMPIVYLLKKLPGLRKLL